MLRHIRLVAVIVALLAPTAETVHARGGARSNSAGGTVHVHGYYRKDGTYVQSYDRTAPGTGSRSFSRSAGNTTSTDAPSFATPAAIVRTLTTTKPTAITATNPSSTNATNASTGTTPSPVQPTVTTSPVTVTPFVTVPIVVNPDAAAQRTYGAVLHNAKQLIKAGLYGPAADYLRRIINGAAGTRIAAEAQRLLASLPQ